MGDRLVVTLIRHGLTKANEKRQYIGHTDERLSEKGIEQLQIMKENMMLRENQLLISSDLIRTVETARLLFGRDVDERLPSLREMNFGDWECKTYEQLKDEQHYQSWLNHLYTVRPPNGENYTEFKERVIEGFQQVLTMAGERGYSHIIIVTHGGVIRQLLATYAPEERELFAWHVPNGAVITLTGNGEHIRRGFRFTSLQEELTTEKIDG